MTPMLLFQYVLAVILGVCVALILARIIYGFLSDLF